MLILPAYSFVNDLLNLAQMHKQWPIHEMRIIGGRFGGKTVNVGGGFSTKLCNLLRQDKDEFVKASCIIYRKTRKDRDDVWYQFNKFLNNTIMEQGVRVDKTHFMWVYENGNEVRFDYTESKSVGKKYGKGKASISGDYIVIIFEEAGEFTQSEITAVLESARGDNPNAQILVICLANPENPRNWFIQDSNKLLKFNPDIMSKKGVQYALIDQNDELGIPKKMLIVYTNWRAIQNYERVVLPNNNFRYIAKPPILVSQDKLDFLVKQYKIDKINAMVADLGCPGSDFTAIYLRDMDNIKPAKYYLQECLSGGVDVGLGSAKKSGKTSACFVAYDFKGMLNVFGEYVWDNKFMYRNPEQIADDIVQFYVAQIKNYCALTGAVVDYNNPVYIKVDFSDKAFIRLLNQKAEQYGIDYFGFVECVKWEVNDRVVIVQYLMKRGRIGINPEYCKNLIDELSCAEWDDAGMKPRRKDDNDHSINALEYAIQDFMYNSISDDDKGYIFTKLSIRGKKRI